MQVLTAEEIKRRIRHRPHLKLVEGTFSNVRTPAEWIDAEYGRFRSTPHSVLYQGTEHPERGRLNKANSKRKYEYTEETLNEEVRAQYPHINLVLGTYRGFLKPAEWQDDLFGEFVKKPYELLKRKMEHPLRKSYYKFVDKLKKEYPTIHLIPESFKGLREPARFVDAEYGEWEQVAQNVLRTGMHPDRFLKEKKQVPVEEVLKQLPEGIRILNPHEYKGITHSMKFTDGEAEWEETPQRFFARKLKSKPPPLKKPVEEVLAFLKANCPYITLDVSTYESSSKKALFIDKEYGSWWVKFSWIQQGARHPQRGRLRQQTLESEMAEWLQHKRPELKLKPGTYTRFTEPAIFIDSEHGEFIQTPVYIKRGARHPERWKEPSNIEKILGETLGIDPWRKRVPKLGKMWKKPDFKLTDTIYVEADGLWWHSDQFKNPSAHLDRREAFEAQGLRLFQFRSDEILEKLPIVVSILNNARGLNQRQIGARKCTAEKKSLKSFFEANHLMGSRRGATEFALIHQGEIVAGMSCKVKGGELHVERFCTVLNTSVAGGFSKLLKFAISQYEGIERIVNFVDLRYGTGRHLIGKGFELERVTLGWRWTDCVHTYNRLRCRANMDERKLTEAQHAEELKWYRIYDAGQAKYVKTLQ